MRKPIIAGNWKMCNTIHESIDLVTGLKRELADYAEVEVVVCPPFTAIASVEDVLSGTVIGIGAQNLYWEEKGAYTGEVSAKMLVEAGAKYVILGHSERRTLFNETSQEVNKKLKTALKEGLIPIVCVGETLEQREKEETMQVIESQIKESLADISAEEMVKSVVAYEPVWAIGTGLTATPEQAQEVHKKIRDILKELYNEQVAEAVRIQYGGSVKPDNAAILMAQPDVDGALVGGASLNADSFSQIVKYQTSPVS